MHFDHERIPERVVHARGSAAHGFFECLESCADVTIADFLQRPGERGKGIATKLVERAVEMLPAKTELLLLQTQHDNATAQGFFKKLGFKEYGYLPKAFKRNGEYKDCCLTSVNE